MGYVLLCQEQIDQATQFLQKCLQQPGTLSYGRYQKGAAHFYLCVALHRRATAASAGSSPGHYNLRHEEVAAAEEQFRNGQELLPHFSRALAELLLSSSQSSAAFTAS